MQDQAAAAHPAQDADINLDEIFRALARRWKFIGFITLLFAAAFTGIAFTIKPVYKAEVLMLPVTDSTGAGGGLAALTSQYGALASMAGFSLGSKDKSEGLATLSSRLLTETYIRDNNLLPILFEKRWDAEKQQFKPDMRGKVPTLWDGNKKFNKRIRNIVEEKKTGLVRLSISWTDPVLAAQWANDMVKMTNQMLRQRAIDLSTRNINYLNEQLEKTSMVELRQSIFRLIEAEVKNVMVAQGNEQFAFKIVDPAVVPQEKDKPRKSLYLLIGAFLGLLSASIMVLRQKPSSR